MLNAKSVRFTKFGSTISATARDLRRTGALVAMTEWSNVARGWTLLGDLRRELVMTPT